MRVDMPVTMDAEDNPSETNNPKNTKQLDCDNSNQIDKTEEEDKKHVSKNNGSKNVLNSKNCTIFCDRHRHTFGILLKVLLLIGYLVYFGFALSYRLGDEGSWRLLGCTVLAAWLISWHFLKQTSFHVKYSSIVEMIHVQYSKGKRSLVIRWILYLVMTMFMVIYIIIFVAIKSPANLQSLIGIFLFPLMLFLYSNNKRKINWHTVFWSMYLQFIMALLILKTTWGASIIQWCGSRLQEFVSTGEAGSKFIFGSAWTEHPFAFGSMVQIFVLIVGLSVLTYLGVIKFVVETVGRALAFCIDVSPPEGINAIGNIFLHIPESAMLVQEYLPDMTPSQLFVTYTGGMATVGGVALVIFMGSGIPAAPLVAASAMSAPASLAVCKLVFPSTDDEEVPQASEIETENSNKKREGFLRIPTSMMDAIILGINQSVVLVVQAVAFIMTAVIILEFINNIFIWFGDRIGVENMSVEFLMSYAFYPLAFIMGARPEDCLFIGKLLGIRTFSLAVVAYPKLGPVVQNGLAFREYTENGVNNTWTQVGDDILLDTINKTLIGGVMEARSEIIATYSLCGSASFAIMGLIIGSFEVIVPHRIKEVTTHIFRALVAGTVASYLTACFAGLLFEEDIPYGS